MACLDRSDGGVEGASQTCPLVVPREYMYGKEIRVGMLSLYQYPRAQSYTYVHVAVN